MQELRHAKTDRSALAALFVELAVRLKDEGDDSKATAQADPECHRSMRILWVRRRLT